MTRTLTYALLTLIVIGYWIVGGLFAIRTPDWQAPDEPAHYNYVRQVATEGCCPIIEDGDWDNAYLETVKAARFAPDTLSRVTLIEYEDHQPPLYYLLLSPVYSATNGDLIALRLVSVAMGTLIVIGAFGVGRLMFPERPGVALGAAAFVAFLPQHVAILASVNNDALGWGLVAVILWASVAHVKDVRAVKPWMLGVLVGLALVTKSTAYLMAGVAFLAVLLQWWQSHRHEDVSPLPIGAIFTYLVPALALGLLWWLRNFDVYGFPDFLGLAAHDAVVVGQLRTEDHVAALGGSAYLREGLEITLSSFIGRFGWMALPLTGNASVNWIYPAFVGLFGFATVGLLIDRRGNRRDGDSANVEQRHAWTLLALTSVLAVLAFLYYNTEFVQFQGRYMYPILIPLGIWLALGVDGWRRLLLGRWGWSQWLTPLPFIALAALDVWLLWRVIVPNLTPLV